jgi:hypothetical protein
MMGIVMKKVSLSVAAVSVAMGLGSASAADLGKVYTKAPPLIEVVSPWDFAFGGAIMSNYVFRGVTQSNNQPAGTVYFEPRYNVTPNLQLYVGSAATSISFANRAAAEIDIYGGIRPTFGPVAFDFGVFGYLYPGGTCTGGLPGSGTDANVICPNEANPVFLANGNVMKKDVSFYEVYGKVAYTFNDYFTLGGNVFYSPNFLNTGADGTYASITGKITAPGTFFGTSGIGAYVSGEFGRQWLGTSDAFYGTGIPGNQYQFGIDYADYNTWNVGVGFTYKVFTLDLRYSGTDMSQGDCNAFTSDYNASQPNNVTPINPGGIGSKWCGDTFIAKLSADVTLGALK